MRLTGATLAAVLDRAFLVLAQRTDWIGVIAESNRFRPDPGRGYRTVDAGRALGLTILAGPDDLRTRLAMASLRQLGRARVDDEAFTALLDGDGRPTIRSNGGGGADHDTAVAAATWGLATAVANSARLDIRAAARSLLGRVDGFRATDPYAAATAVLGAVAVLDGASSSIGERLLHDHVGVLRAPAGDGSPWPHGRLGPTAATVAEAMIVAGDALTDERLVEHGLAVLGWLVELQVTVDGWFVFVPDGGLDVERRGATPPGGGSGSRQLPVAAWSTAAACRSAYDHTGDPAWARHAARALAWFAGWNDQGAEVWNAATGGGHDALTPDGVDLDQGAAALLALIGTVHAAAGLTDVGPMLEQAAERVGTVLARPAPTPRAHRARTAGGRRAPR